MPAPRQIAGTDIAALSVTATGATTARTLADRAAEVVNVKDFGAVGDGPNADTAFAAAFAAAESSGKKIKIPAGRYALSQTLTITNKSVCLEGDGSAVTRIDFSGVGLNLFNFPTNAVTYVNVRGLSVVSSVAAGVALTLNYSVGAGLDKKMVEVTDFIVYKSGSGSWAGGIYGYNLCNAVIDGFDMHGASPAAGAAFSSGYGLKLAGVSIDVQLTNTHCTSIDTAIRVLDGTQGVYITNLAAVDVNYGVYSYHTSVHTQQPLINVTNFHINARVCNLYLFGVLQQFITNGLLYAAPSANSAWTGILVDGESAYPSQDVTIEAVQINTASAPNLTSARHINIQAALRVSIEASLFGVLAVTDTVGVTFGASAINSWVKLNQLVNVKTTLSNSGTSCYLLGNFNSTFGYLNGSPLTAYNSNSASTINKAAEVNFHGTDTAGTIKLSGKISSVPANANYTGAGFRFQTRNAEALVTSLELLPIGSMTLPKLAAAPSSPVEGESYYDTVLKKSRTWDGTVWNNWF